MITEIKGDITKVKYDYICQQNNCIAVKPHGLSSIIATELGVCPYSRRRADGKKNLAIEEDRPPLGRILGECNFRIFFHTFVDPVKAFFESFFSCFVRFLS